MDQAPPAPDQGHSTTAPGFWQDCHCRRHLEQTACVQSVYFNCGFKGASEGLHHWALVESSKGYLIKLIGRIDDVFRLSLWSWWVCLCCRHSDILSMVSGLS